MKRPSGTRLLGILLAASVLAIAAAELGYRAFAPQDTREDRARLRDYLLTGTMHGFEARAYTVYQRPRQTRGNRLGFSDVQWTRARTPGVPRILCMGGSTTESGNVQGLQGSYPYLLERTLEARTGRDFEVMNAGISGWTSAEMVVSWFLTLQDFEPDVVVLHEAVNDLEPRFWAGFEPDYSHWRRPIQVRPAKGIRRWLTRWSELYVALRLRRGKAPNLLGVSTHARLVSEPMTAEGKLPHETSLAFRRNIESLARSARGAGRTVVLMTLPPGPVETPGKFWRYGIDQNNQHLRELAAERGYLLADAARAFDARPEMGQHYIDMVHLQPPGNQLKAELLADALAGWVAALSPEGQRPPIDAVHSAARLGGRSAEASSAAAGLPPER